MHLKISEHFSNKFFEFISLFVLFKKINRIFSEKVCC